MVAMEIVLLIAGGIIFILSFIVPVKREEMSKETRQQVQSEIKGMVSDEMNGAKSRIEDIVDETVNYSIEKTERALDRLTNEKIMAVNEYSDTVLEEINKNHKEVLFLYDMLNDKHQNVKETVSEAVRTVKEVTQTAMETEQAVQPADNMEQEQESFLEETPSQKTPRKTNTGKKAQKQPEKTEGATAPDISFISESKTDGRNNNERILELHKQGKSNVAIAKELGLGVGEIKLVIDLFEGM